MKEEEARTKWCPKVSMIQFEGSIVDNRGDYFEGTPCRCIASDCMMWRLEVSPRSAAEINARGDAGAEAKGYCGLAGKP